MISSLSFPIFQFRYFCIIICIISQLYLIVLSSFYQENEGKKLNFLLQAMQLMSITEKDELNNIFLSKFNYRGIVVFSALVSISKRKYLPKDARGKAELLPSNCQYTCRARIALWWYKNEKWGKSILQSWDWQEKLCW